MSYWFLRFKKKKNIKAVIARRALGRVGSVCPDCCGTRCHAVTLGAAAVAPHLRPSELCYVSKVVLHATERKGWRCGHQKQRYGTIDAGNGNQRRCHTCAGLWKRLTLLSATAEKPTRLFVLSLPPCHCVCSLFTAPCV